MSDAGGVKRPTTIWEAPAVKPLDEAVWRAWIAKGRARDRQSRETRIKGATFAALALIYNPVAPVFSFTGNWQRALLVASGIPFVTSLARRDLKAAHIE